MGDKQFTNPTGAFGYTADGDVLGCVFAPFKVAESSSGAITILRGAIQQITTSGTVLTVDTAQTDTILGDRRIDTLAKLDLANRTFETHLEDGLEAE